MTFLIEESTTEKVPELLELIIKKITCQSDDYNFVQKDLLFIIIVVLMMENGLMPVNKNMDIIDPRNSIDIAQLLQWKSRVDLYESSFIMRGFKNITVKLIMSPLGAVSVVNAVLADFNSETYTVCLPMSRYIVSPLAATVPMKFRDLKQFSTLFKNKIICPIKSSILSYYGYANASLMGLPEEILFKILILMPVNDILSTSKTCKRMKYLLDADTLWHDLFRRDFDISPQNDYTEWKKQYRNAYIAKQMQLKCKPRTSGTMHDYMDYSDYVSYIDNSMWDIII